MPNLAETRPTTTPTPSLQHPTRSPLRSRQRAETRKAERQATPERTPQMFTPPRKRNGSYVNSEIRYHRPSKPTRTDSDQTQPIMDNLRAATPHSDLRASRAESAIWAVWSVVARLAGHGASFPDLPRSNWRLAGRQADRDGRPVVREHCAGSGGSWRVGWPGLRWLTQNQRKSGHGWRPTRG